jgi:hypothetical protein
MDHKVHGKEDVRKHLLPFVEKLVQAQLNQDWKCGVMVNKQDLSVILMMLLKVCPDRCEREWGS